MRIATYFGPTHRNDGPPFHVLQAMNRIPDVQAFLFMCYGDPKLFGKFDLHVAVDWSEDTLGYWKFVEPRPLVYWMSDSHMGTGAQKYRYEKAARCDRVYCLRWDDPERLKKIGIEAKWMPAAAEPVFWHPRDIQPTYDLIHYGNVGLDPRRQDFLEEMFKAFPNFNLTWRGKYLHEASEFVASGKVSLNYTQSDSTNLRVFETMANAGCLLTNRTTDLEFLGLKDGVHCMIYDTIEEAKDKCSQLLNDEELRWNIGQRARQWVLDGHTFMHRAYDIVGLPMPSPEEMQRLINIVPGQDDDKLAKGINPHYAVR